MEPSDPQEAVTTGTGRRFGRVLVEVVSVVFAVLVALAMDEWWEGRELEALGDRTLDAIAGEIRRNRAQLIGSAEKTDLDAAVRSLDAAIAAYRSGDEPAGGLTANWDVSLLSSAAWESATLTGAAPYIALEHLIDLAQVYELQRYYRGLQEQLSNDISLLGARIVTDPLPALTSFRFRFVSTAGARQTLISTYACALVRLEVATEDEAADCPAEAITEAAR